MPAAISNESTLPRTRSSSAGRWRPRSGSSGAFGSIWATGSQGLIRIDPRTNKVLATIPVSGAAWTAASTDAIWIDSAGGITRIDPGTNKVSATVKIAGAPLGDPAVIAGKVWVPLIRQNKIVVIDPATNSRTSSINVGSGPFVVTEIRGEAWIPSWKGTDIWRIRP